MLRRILCLFGRHDIMVYAGPTHDSRWQCRECRRWFVWDTFRGGRYNPGWVRVGS